MIAGLAAVRPVVCLVERGDGQLTALHDHALHVRELAPVLGPQHRLWTKRRKRRRRSKAREGCLDQIRYDQMWLGLIQLGLITLDPIL